LAPGDSYGGTATVTATLTEGEQELQMNVTAAVESLTWSDGTAWRGRYRAYISVLVRVRKPTTLAERRAYHLAEGGAALSQGQPEATRRHATEVLRESPNDRVARYMLGNAFFAMRRYLEAIAEYEIVKPATPRRSILYLQLAYSYLAIGDEQRAEITLRGVQPPNEVQRSLETMRAALRRQGGIR
jgi:predicted Zn-dependent protease